MNKIQMKTNKNRELFILVNDNNEIYYFDGLYGEKNPAVYERKDLEDAVLTAKVLNLHVMCMNCVFDYQLNIDSYERAKKAIAEGCKPF